MRIFVLCCLLLFALDLGAKEYIGKVVAVEGEATTKTKGKKKRKLTRGSAIFTDEIIQTQGASKLQIRFTDNSALNLIPNTKYQIQAYSYTDDKNSNQYVGQVFTGGFRHLTGNISKTNPDKVKVRTPTATIGVRGTIFEVLLLPNQAMTVGCTFGQISLSNPAGQIQLGPSEPFQFSTVSAGAAPQGVSSRPANFNETIFTPPKIGGMETPDKPHSEEAPSPARIRGGC